MYIVIKEMKVEKGHLDEMTEKFKKQSAVQKSPGFVKTEFLVDKKDKDFDLIRQQIYFVDRKAYYIWQGSDAHINAHKFQRENNIQKPEYIIETNKKEFDLVLDKKALTDE